jgi:cytochrome c oxidase subunit 3
MQKSIMPSSATRTGVWAGIGAIIMSFAAYTSAMVVRQGSSPDWLHFTLPPILYWNSLILVVSSGVLELARTRVGGPFDRLGYANALSVEHLRERLFWLRVTIALGFVFLAGQYLAWRSLSARGVFVATSPSSSFFYLLTAVHAFHLIGGLGALVYALRCLHTDDGPRAVQVLGAVALYWHFMAVLWVYLLVVLTMWV